jgi:succinoglycan biosynthesis protein ExoA
MPVRNEEQHIAETLQHLLDQEDAGFGVEILVADGQSTDRTREIVERMSKAHSNIRLLDNPGRLSSSARNIAIEKSRGEFLVLIDGHCEIRSRSYFIDLVDAFERTGADCLGRPQPLDVSDASPLQQAIAAARNCPLGHHPDSYIYSDKELKVPALSVAIAYRRQIFDELGMFDTRFDACEDCDMNHRIDQHGMSCFLVPKLAVHYQPRASLRGLFKQLTRYGQGRVRLARKHADSLSLSSIIPALFLLGLLSGPIVCYLLPVLWPVYWGVILLYAAVVIGFSLQAVVKSKNWRSVIWLPAVFLTIHLGSGWGVVKEFLLGKGTAAKNVGKGTVAKNAQHP